MKPNFRGGLVLLMRVACLNQVKAEVLLEQEPLVAKARNVMQEYAMNKNVNESREYLNEFPRAQRGDVIKIWVEDALEAGTEPGVVVWGTPASFLFRQILFPLKHSFAEG
mmetsp:Transcript_7316/g.32429  ORF Transcript_7316/g.32429 Transcript_7316/m.32429 type:complete len:110 (-) Transcript_7316:448-777(-)